ncbi:MAG TPA: hypothetical protein VKN99_10055 [Polyangia bacterium]|nr:hypothetical protein [Polyangia bacterium]
MTRLVGVLLSLSVIGLGCASGQQSGAGGTGGTGGAGGVGMVCTDPSSTTGDGCAGTGLPKCALTFPMGATTASFNCTTGGSATTGQPCDRPTNTPGVDTCVAGDFCSALDVPSGRVCRRICTSAAGCGAGESCFEVGNPYGACRASTCDPFAAASPCPQSNPLAMSQVCTWGLLTGRTASAPMCTLGGPVGVGGACNATATPPTLCTQGAVCLNDNRCHKLCDGAHGCPGTGICQGAAYDNGAGGTIMAPGPNGGGWCN